MLALAIFFLLSVATVFGSKSPLLQFSEFGVLVISPDGKHNASGIKFPPNRTAQELWHDPDSYVNSPMIDDDLADHISKSIPLSLGKESADLIHTALVVARERRSSLPRNNVFREQALYRYPCHGACGPGCSWCWRDGYGWYHCTTTKFCQCHDEYCGAWGDFFQCSPPGAFTACMRRRNRQCFGANMTVLLADGEEISVTSLAPGMKPKCKEGDCEVLFVNVHEEVPQMLSLHVEDIAHPLIVSGNHFVMVSGKGTAAQFVDVGTMIDTVHGARRVTKVDVINSTTDGVVSFNVKPARSSFYVNGIGATWMTRSALSDIGKTTIAEDLTDFLADAMADSSTVNKTVQNASPSVRSEIAHIVGDVAVCEALVSKEETTTSHSCSNSVLRGRRTMNTLSAEADDLLRGVNFSFSERFEQKYPCFAAHNGPTNVTGEQLLGTCVSVIVRLHVTELHESFFFMAVLVGGLLTLLVITAGITVVVMYRKKRKQNTTKTEEGTTKPEPPF